jgi:hypothetical protein
VKARSAIIERTLELQRQGTRDGSIGGLPLDEIQRSGAEAEISPDLIPAAAEDLVSRWHGASRSF